MLFTDSPAITPQDLADHETAILDTANIEGINLTVKIGLASDEVGLELQGHFPRRGLAPLALNTVVITPALRLWLIFHTLEIAYRDAYHNQLNDRYKAKWDEYKQLSRFAADLLAPIGVGTVTDPIPQAAKPVLGVVTGGLTAGTYFVEVAWKNAGGDEGAPSELTGIDVTNGKTFQVQAVNPPGNAVAWNVYAGVAPDALFLQNPAPLAVGATWTAPDSGLITSGQQPGFGQQPQFLSPAPRIMLRG
jgi:hypothetical protein